MKWKRNETPKNVGKFFAEREDIHKINKVDRRRRSIEDHENVNSPNCHHTMSNKISMFVACKLTCTYMKLLNSAELDIFFNCNFCL